jgi:hypothetical protein
MFSKELRMRAFGALGIILACIQGAAAQTAQPDANDDGDFWSRITVATPFFTQHFPHDRDFNDKNWGGFVFGQITDQLYVAGGDFINSYKRNTAFVGVAYFPLNLTLSRIQIDAGGLIGVDLNGGYKGYNTLDPAVGTLNIKLSGKYFDDPDYAFFNRAGLLLTVIPGVTPNTSTAVNLALTYRL